jgi:hypothetical protein
MATVSGIAARRESGRGKSGSMRTPDHQRGPAERSFVIDMRGAIAARVPDTMRGKHAKGRALPGDPGRRWTSRPDDQPANSVAVNARRRR